MNKIRRFFNKRNATGILISGLAGFLVLTYTGLGATILAYVEQMKKGK